VTCDEVREQLPEHLLGVLEPEADATVRRHLRGCGGCRGELASLGEGLATFARAAHQHVPPPELRERVLAVVEDERADAPAPLARLPLRRRPAVVRALVAAALVVALLWAGAATVWGRHQSQQAASYQAFLDALGGKDVRVAVLHGGGRDPLDGSAVLYDSDVGQSWVLVLVRAPGMTGEAHVVLTSPTQRIRLFPVRFDADGDGSTWLVTSADIMRFDHVRVLDAHGHTLAVGTVRTE
jgi:Putative zinc-finger